VWFDLRLEFVLLGWGFSPLFLFYVLLLVIQKVWIKGLGSALGVRLGMGKGVINIDMNARNT
jgi:hypothetical protein